MFLAMGNKLGPFTGASYQCGGLEWDVRKFRTLTLNMRDLILLSYPGRELEELVLYIPGFW